MKNILLLFFACSAFADPASVILDTPDYTFATLFSGLALQPFANNLDYAAEAIPFNYGSGEPAVSPRWVAAEIDTRLHFGFDLGLFGIVHSANAAIAVNWQRYHAGQDSSALTTSGSNMVGPFFELGPNASTYQTATGWTKFHFDEVNFTYGALVELGCLLKTHFFTGVSYSRIWQQLSKQYANLPETIVQTVSSPNHFTGAGPQIGFDLHARIYKGFQLNGHGRATLYVGKFISKTTFTTSSPDLGALSPNTQTIHVDAKLGLVPGVETKLGLAYEGHLPRDYMFRFEAGYQAQIYLDALRTIDLNTEGTLAAAGTVGSATTGVYARTFTRVVSSFALAGPYVSVDLAY